MANTGFKGQLIKQTGVPILFDQIILDSSGNAVTTGSAFLEIHEIQSDGTIKVFEWNNTNKYTFQTTGSVLTASSAVFAHQKNGLWTYALSATNASNFTVGAIYVWYINHSSGSPNQVSRRFQYGSAEGDLAVTASVTSGLGYIQSIGGQVPPSTSNIRKQYDLPIWEWCRFAPVAASASTTMCASDNFGNQRYIYYNIATGSNFWRYDTWSDSWQQLSSPINTPTSPSDMVYTSYQGWQTRCIANLSSTTFQIAGVFSEVLSGSTVRITAGTGAGQSRTVSSTAGSGSVAEVVVADNGVATTVTTTSISDTTKNWTVNQWAGYQCRITNNTGSQQIGKILYNNATTLTIGDVNANAFDNQANAIWSTALSTTAGSQSQYAIESSVVTITSPWTTNPDYTSRFQFLTGGIWLMHATGTNYGLQYYDIISDTWFAKTNQSNVIGGLLSTDVKLQQISEPIGSYLSGTASSGAAKSLTDSTQTMSLNRYANYLIKIMSGTGAGQTRTILANTTTVFYVIKNWDVNPDNTSVYKVYADFDKIWMIGNNNAAMYQYSIDSDFLSAGKQIDWGCARIGSVGYAGVNQQSIPISTFTNSVTTGTITTSINHNFQTGQSIIAAGCTSGDASIYNNTFTITAVTSTTITVTLSSTPSGSAVYGANSTTVLVDATKNWTTNSLTGLCVCYMTGAAASQTGTATSITAQIASNTSNTITFTTAQSSAPVNGTSRYVIFDPKAFGTDSIQSAQNITNNGYGIATSGSTTTLVDSTKSWTTNQWSTGTSRKVHIISGTGAGSILAITSNTATTLTYATQSFTPDATTVYRILDAFGYSTTTGTTTTLTDANQNWATNEWGGQVVIFTGGAGVSQQSIIASNTSTTLTFAAVTTAPTSSTTYSILSQPISGAGNGLVWASNTTDTNTKGQYLFVIHANGTAIWSRYNISTEQAKLITTNPFFETLSIGSMFTYDNSNRIYFQKDTTLRVYYYDCVLNQISPASLMPYNSGAAIIGNRMEIIQTVDGINFIYVQKHSSTDFLRVLVFW